MKELEHIIDLLECVNIDGDTGIEGYTSDLLEKCKSNLLEIIKLQPMSG